MKKLIVIEDNSEIKVGDIAKSKSLDYGQQTPDIIIKIFNGVVYYSQGCTGLISETQKVQLHIVDTLIKPEIGEYKYLISSKIVREVAYKEEEFYKGYKVIATSNPSLPLPQLSNQAIELIVEKNGELGEFDVKFIPYYDECKTGDSRDKVNIIPKSSISADEYLDSFKVNSFKEQSIEEAAYGFSKTYKIRQKFSEMDLYESFKEGAKSNAAKELHTKGMYSKEEVDKIIKYTYDNPRMSDCYAYAAELKIKI